MKKNIFLKKILIGIASPTILITPMLVASCSSDLPYGDISKQEQVSLLESQAAKIALLDNWLTSTYTSLYVDVNKKDLSFETKEKISNTIKYYLDYLTWPDANGEGNLVGSDKKIKFASDSDFNNDDKKAFETKLKDAYIFYVTFNSTISNGSDENAIIPKMYFKNKTIEWQKNKYSMWSKKVTDKTIADFNPPLNFLGTKDNGDFDEESFQILLLTRGTEVYQNVMKLLLSEMYFLNATEDQIKKGTNFNKMTSNASSVNYIDTMAYVETKNGARVFDNFLFKKYLIENAPSLKWSYSDSDYTTQVQESGRISSMNQFNNISTTLEKTLPEVLVPNSKETKNNSLTKLHAFNSFSVKSESSTDGEFKGDLAVDSEAIKLFGSSKMGLLDTEKNMLFTFSEFEAIKKAREYNKTNNLLMIPSITIKEVSKNKKTKEITINDLEIKWDGADSSIVDEKEGKFKYNNGVEQILKINSIHFQPSKTDSKKISISFTYSFIHESNEYKFDYGFTLENWWENDKDEINEFQKSYYFAGDPNQIGVKIFDADGKVLGISYHLRVLPIFNKKGQIVIGDEWYMMGEYSMENTPWNTKEEQKKLIYFFMLSDSNLYKTIQDFYLFNNYNIQGEISQLEKLVSDLGLTKKTNDDRKNAGIE